MDRTVKAGDPLKARILDVNKKDGVVDLSLRLLHTAAGSKKAARGLSLMEVYPTNVAFAALDSVSLLCNLQSFVLLPNHQQKAVLPRESSCAGSPCHVMTAAVLPLSHTYIHENCFQIAL